MQVCEDDIECHSFEEIATEPATALTTSLENGVLVCKAQADPLVNLVVAEMNAFREVGALRRGVSRVLWCGVPQK